MLFAVTALLSPGFAVPNDVRVAQSICVYNHGAFVLRWRLKNVATGAESSETHDFPVGKVKCISALSVNNVTAGSAVVPVVKAVLGKEVTPSGSVLFDPANASQVTYVCRGVSFDFQCREEPPPPTAADVAGDMGEFLLGFAESLAPQLGFSDCVSDLNATYQAVTAAVDLFESGINQKNPVAVLKAFELISSVLKDVSAAIKDCSKDAAELAAKVSGASKALKGNAMGIIKFVVDDFIHIWRDRYEITDDCKTAAADWRAGDFEGAGRAVGNITAIVIKGL